MRKRKRAHNREFESLNFHHEVTENQQNDLKHLLDKGPIDTRWTNLMSEPNRIYPYRPPRLIEPRPKSKKQLWLIRYSAWSKDKGRLVDRSEYGVTLEVDGVSTFHNFLEFPEQDRRALAKIRMDSILAELQAGGHIHEALQKEKQRQKQIKTHSHLKNVSESFYDVLELKKSDDIKFTKKIKKTRDSTVETYAKIVKKFNGWIQRTNYKNYSAPDITSDHIAEYLNFIKLKKDGGKMAERTLNNHLLTLKILFNALGIKPNPAEEIQPGDNHTRKNIAFAGSLKKTLLDYMTQTEQFDMRLGSLHMYHTLERTNEMSHLKCENIGQFSPNKLFLPREFSKNRQERYIPIHPEIIEDLYRIKREFPHDYYVFGKGFAPSHERETPDDLAQHFSKCVLRPLGIPFPPYGFYSWKHTGVCDWISRPDFDKGALMVQGGWLNMSSMDKYLKSVHTQDWEVNIENKPNIL